MRPGIVARAFVQSFGRSRSSVNWTKGHILSNPTRRKTIDLGVEMSRSLMLQHDKIWSKYSHDKVDIGEKLAKIIRTLAKALPLSRSLRALSIGSSSEPQFRILEANFRGGLYLLDIEKAPLDLIRERIRRQDINRIFTLRRDFNKIFLDSEKTRTFLAKDLEGKKLEFITLQHSMYYCEQRNWEPLIRNLYTTLLAPKGAIYCVLMSPRSKDSSTTTWLYNHFSGRFFNHRNDQDLLRLKTRLRRDKAFEGAQIEATTAKVRFFANNFGELMSVIWMILLYPDVHPYTVEQRREITEYVYEHFFASKNPLFQHQDHLVIYQGLGFKGLI